MRIASCRSCGEPIIWTETTNGKRMPVDAEPVPAGQWALDDRYATPRAGKIVKAAGSSEDGFTSHFSTCLFADEHRSRR